MNIVASKSQTSNSDIRQRAIALAKLGSSSSAIPDEGDEVSNLSVPESFMTKPAGSPMKPHPQRLIAQPVPAKKIRYEEPVSDAKAHRTSLGANMQAL